MKTILAFLLVITCSVTTLWAQVDERTFKKKYGQDRVALVIGNSAYQHTTQLKNPVNDAADMEASLRKKGFQVTLLKDATKRQMIETIAQFGKDLQKISDSHRKGGVGLFFYAGHGIQYEGVNYLIPVDAKIEEGNELQFDAVNANRILAKMESANNDFNIVILDACRDNPFRGWTRGVKQGLSEMKTPRGSFLAYATAPGDVAADGTGDNGVFTKHFLTQMEVPGLEISQMFKKVIRGVRIDTGNKQVPWQNASMEGDFYFTPIPLPEKQLIDSSQIVASVKTSGSSSIPPPPPPVLMKGHIQVNVNARAAKVFINDSYAGLAFPGKPLNYSNVSVGKARVRVEAKDYQTQSKTIEVQSNSWSQMVFELSYMPPPPKITAPKGFVLIQPGTFKMGSTDGDGDEKPVHPVRISRSFYISDHEVTVAEYRQFVEATGHREPKGCYGPYDNWGKSNRDNHPINCVSWNDAQTYIKWLNHQSSGAVYRLCTEAEWEYVARARTTTKWSCGNNKSCLNDHAWYYGNNTPDGTKAFKTKKPNAWGVYDMHGNVWEWVQDTKCSYDTPLNENNERVCSGSGRVFRGGSFSDIAGYARSALRYGDVPSDRGSYLGFRLCSSL